MELRQLRYFAVICEEGSLTRAGARLFLAQQSLSATVASLEAELGVRLLERGSFGVRTTAAGRVLCERGSALLAEADRVARSVQEAGGEGSGEVRIRYGLDAEHHVTPLLARARERLPQVSVLGWTASDRDNLRALRAGEADLVLAWAVGGHGADLHTATVVDEECWAAVPQGHPLAGRASAPAEALAGRDLVMFPREAAPAVWDRIAGHFDADGRVPPRITQTPVSGQAAMVDEAVRSLAVAPVSRSLVPGLDRPGVSYVPFEPPLTVPLQLVWRDGLPRSAAEFLAAVTSGTAAEALTR